MPRRSIRRPDLFLLLSLLFVIIAYPLVEATGVGRAFIGFAIFVPLSFATIEMSTLRGWGSRALMLIGWILVLSIAEAVTNRPVVSAARWLVVALFLGLSVSALFSYLWTVRIVNTGHLYTATSIYLLLAFFWFALYTAVEAVRPGAFLRNTEGPPGRPSDLLYFSFVTLTTSGYGDILPVYGTVRILAALEACTGVLYVAIMIALLVSAYRQVNK